MKLAIVHLSDIHFKGKNDVGFKRREKLANTIAFSRSPDERLLFIVTGDIAYSGTTIQYEAASDFFLPLLLGFGLEINSSFIPFIPGNHDCDFSGVGDLRPSLLEKIPDQLDSLDVN